LGHLLVFSIPIIPAPVSKSIFSMLRLSRLTFTLLLVASFFSLKSQAQEVKDGLTWYTDINQVYELSEKTKKPVFAFFTGSDWCGWCHRLEANVYSKAGFKEWAKNNVILLELDFPRNKQLPEAQMRQNVELSQFFQVRGYPTVWVFYMHKNEETKKMNIEPLGSLSYPQSAPGKEEATFLASANAVLKNKK
jgi:thioredoxin-related protein